MNVVVDAPRIGDWMQTYSGKRYYPVDPRIEDVDINDIAHALSHLCRYGGHCSRFYSVAEHSVLVSQVVPTEYALQGLLHDATEAYCVDIPRPLKRFLSNYAEIEHRNWLVISKYFGLPEEMHSSVHEADNNVLLTERNELLNHKAGMWNVPGTPANVDVIGWAPEVARLFFLRRFFELTA